MPSGEVQADRARVTLHVVASLDGFIANASNTVSWLDGYDEVYDAGVDDNAAAMQGVVSSIQCYVLGSRTYTHALELGWPYGDTPTIVLTKRELPVHTAHVEFYDGELTVLMKEILSPRFDDVWVVGGASVCQAFLRADLVDVIRLSIAPILLGDGLRLFGDLSTERRWLLRDVIAFRNGFVELVYARN